MSAQVTVQRYESLSHALAEIPRNEATAAFGRRFTGENADGWSEGTAGPKGAALARAIELGEPELTQRVSEQLDKIEAELPATLGNMRAPAICGGSLCVADALSGEPESFRALEQRIDEANPVHIYVNATAAFCVGAATISRRGAAVAALAQRVGAMRPTTLSLIYAATAHTTRNKFASIVVIDVDVRAMDLSSIAFALSSPAVLRRIAIPLYAIGTKLSASDAGSEGFPLLYDELVRAALEVAERDLYLPQLMNNGDFPRDAAAWVREQVAKLTAPE